MSIIQRINPWRTTRHLWYRIWWRVMPGQVIDVAWPVGWTEPDHFGTSWESADPNDHYRPWMEANVGQQGWDWNWDVLLNSDGSSRVLIKFRKGKESEAMAAWIKWA